MTSINSSNNSTPKAYASAGFSGLASGLDTESMVKQMLAGTQNKIDKQTALKQQTQWKQDAYRDIISSFHSFQNKFFNYLSPKSNLLSASFYNTKAVSSSSSAVKVSVLGDVLSNKLTINSISSLATATKATGASTVSSGAKLNIDSNMFADVDSATVNITLDGITKSVVLSKEILGDSPTSEAILQNLQSGINKAFGNGITVETDGTIKVDQSRQITITGDSNAQKILGINGSVSNKISLTRSLSDLSFNKQLVGSSYTFSINGEEFKFDNSNTMNDIIRQINSSKAGVRVSYSSLTDKFSIESTTTGADVGIEMSQSEGNLLESMFGVGSGSSVTSNTLANKVIHAKNPSSLDDIKSGGVFNLNVNGVNHSIEVPADDKYVLDDIIAVINKGLEDKLGKDGVKLVNNEGSFSLEIKGNHKVKIDASTGTLGEKFGFVTGDTNAITADTNFSELGVTGAIHINGKSFDFTDKKVSDLIAWQNDDVKFTFDENSGKISMQSLNSSALTISGSTALQKLFNTDEIHLNSTSTNLDIVEGKNAVLTVNGQEIQRNTNDFNIDGYQISLQSETTTPITLSAENNTEQIMDGIVQFVNEYNSMIEKINALTSAKAVYKDYPPLTDEQKKEMTDKEIELWEEKSKEGLLSGDSQLNSVLSQMRTLLYTKPEGSTIALYDIGITTSNNYLDKGKLVIDEDKLRTAINQDPAQINLLFTDKNAGLAVSFNKLIDRTAKSSVGSPGTLVQLAGVKNTATDKKNSLYTRMDEIDKVITRLKARYEQEKSRYWKQFTSLEKVINQTNSQSSWLTNMFQ